MNVIERTKVTEVTVWVFAKPPWEMEIEGWKKDISTAEEIENNGTELQQRLQRKAQIMRDLLLNRMERRRGLVSYFLLQANPILAGEERIGRLGIDPNEVSLDEHEDETDAFP